MTPEQAAAQAEIVAEVAAHYGRLGQDGVMELALVSPDLAWALDNLRDHYLEVQAGDLE